MLITDLPALKLLLKEKESLLFGLDIPASSLQSLESGPRLLPLRHLRLNVWTRAATRSTKSLLTACSFPGSKNYWSDIEVISTQYNLNIAPMCFAAWVVLDLVQ